jgi:solute carrier family 29 (equilibrative nucleoside transporter), member 1/2/3
MPPAPSAVQRLLDALRLGGPTYKPLSDDNDEQDSLISGSRSTHSSADPPADAPFSALHYAVFALLGVAMLWAWYAPPPLLLRPALTRRRNMFLAAGPYFQSRLAADDWIYRNFQPSELVVSTLANLGTMLILTNLQAHASYPRRILAALAINIGVFALMALSTRTFLDVSARGYFAFLVLMIFVSSAATGLMQNGIFAYMSGFGREEYAQGNMTGQAVAGVLPCVVQIVSVLSAPLDAARPEVEAPVPSSAALAYFSTAAAISFVTLLAFVYLLHATREKGSRSAMGEEAPRTKVSLLLLYRKTFYLSTAVFLNFCITMFFPVFTVQIQSVHPPENIPLLLQPAVFITLSFLIWNSGDLLGRLLSAIPAIRITHKPRLVLGLCVARVLFIPLYLLCNRNGQGARVNSDFFYLIVVQLGFGVSSGFVGTICMMGGTEYVDVEERPAAGAFMTLMLVAGLAVGSFLSFLVA